MEQSDLRRTERIAIDLPVEVSGTDGTGRVFLEEGSTVLISHHGAKISLPKILVPDQEIYVRCKQTGKEALARVVGALGDAPSGTYYGVTFLDKDSNPWGIEFPPLTEGADAVGRVLLECVACHTRQVSYLDEFELEVLEANSILSRHCSRCRDASVWKKSFEEVSLELIEEKSGAAKRDLRREPRRDLRIQACIRSARHGNDIVMTLNISRGGLCFESRQSYEKDAMVEVALPYSKGGGNIFVPAQIARRQHVPSQGTFLYGAFYIKGPQYP